MCVLAPLQQFYLMKQQKHLSRAELTTIYKNIRSILTPALVLEPLGDLGQTLPPPEALVFSSIKS